MPFRYRAPGKTVEYHNALRAIASLNMLQLERQINTAIQPRDNCLKNQLTDCGPTEARLQTPTTG